MEFSPPADRRGERPCACRRLRHRDALRLYARRSRSEIRVHGSKNRISSRDCFGISDAADRRQTGARPAAHRAARRSAGSERDGLVNEIVAPEKLMARARELSDMLVAASPSSVTRAKRLLTTAEAAGIDADLERAVLENARIRCTPDFKEG